MNGTKTTEMANLGSASPATYVQLVTEVSEHSDQPSRAGDEELGLIYDEQCPVCSAYSAAVEVDETQATGLKRINARSSDDPLVRQAVEAGLDLDDGMVVVHKGKLYHGAEALNLMARLAPRKGLGNRVNRLLFSNPTVSRISYPVLRAGRNTLLKLLGRSKIGKR